MNYDFLKKAFNIKSPSETENPNPEYVPPGCEHKSSDGCCVSTDWTDYITITHRLSCALFSVIKNTREFHALKNYCKFYDFVFIVEQTITKPKQINIVFKIPIKQYVSFDTSEEYIDFVKSIINYEPKTKYYSGKIICVSAATDLFTKGKIYEVINGILTGNRGLKFTQFDSLRCLNRRLQSQFIELVE